jgi:uncharacterized RDD family membrane protein YckC
VFCPRCGAANADTEEVCGSCGLPLARSSTTISQPEFEGYAGFWKRFVAYIIDGIIINIVMTAIGYGMGAPIYSRMASSANSIASGRLAIYSIISVVLTWLYFAMLESSSRQATVGKMALSIIVTDMDGKRISFGKATARFWSKILSSFILLIGYIMVGFTQKKQGLHDIIAGTLVVNKPYR